MISIAICDDEKNIIYGIQNMILKLSSKLDEQFVIDGYDDLSKLKAEMLGGRRFDIVFLDIEMPGISGVEMGRFIRNELDDNTTQIVYVSAQRKYAMELFSVRPMDFIVKPMDEKQLEEVLVLGCRLIHNNKKMFEYRIKGELCRVEMSDIYYFQSDARKIKMVTVEGTTEFYEKMEELTERLKPYDFLKTHKSYLVNNAHIIKFTAQSVILDNGFELSVSRNRRDEIRAKCT